MSWGGVLGDGVLQTGVLGGGVFGRRLFGRGDIEGDVLFWPRKEGRIETLLFSRAFSALL